MFVSFLLSIYKCSDFEFLFFVLFILKDLLVLPCSYRRRVNYCLVNICNAKPPGIFVSKNVKSFYACQKFCLY